jgi:alanine racemase
MNFDLLTSNRLEPELYSIEMLQAFDQYLRQEGSQQYPIHSEIETGMNRLGIPAGDMDKLANILLSTSSFSLQTVFSHLAASEEAANDDFSKTVYSFSAGSR